MASLCDQTACGPEDCSTPTLILQQGATESFPFVFHHGARFDIESTQPGSGPTVNLKHQHCFEAGEYVHLIHQDNSPCGGDGGCAQIASVVDDYTVTLSGITTTAPGGSNGYLVRAMDLTGIRLEGGVRTRPKNQMISTTGLRASGFAGTREVLIDGTCDVNQGDLISIPSMGILDARILAVYKKESSAPDPATANTVQTATASRGCGCAIKPTSMITTGYQCDSVLVMIDQQLPTQFIDETGVEIKGNELFNFTFNYHMDDPKCGIIHYAVQGLDTMGIPIQSDPNACADQAYKIGMYSICMKRGWGNRVPAHYPQANYDSSVINIRTGPVFLVPSYC